MVRDKAVEGYPAKTSQPEPYHGTFKNLRLDGASAPVDDEDK
jgi:hypothetical protein